MQMQMTGTKGAAYAKGDYGKGNAYYGKGWGPSYAHDQSLDGWGVAVRHKSRLGKGKTWILCQNYKTCGGACFLGPKPPSECYYCRIPFDFSNAAPTNDGNNNKGNGTKGKGRGKGAPEAPAAPEPVCPVDPNDAANELIKCGLAPDQVPNILNKFCVKPAVIKPVAKAKDADTLHSLYKKAVGKHNEVLNEFKQQEQKLDNLLEQARTSKATLEELSEKCKSAQAEMLQAKASVQEAQDQAAIAAIGTESDSMPIAATLNSVTNKLSGISCSDTVLAESLSQIVGMLQQILLVHSNTNLATAPAPNGPETPVPSSSPEQTHMGDGVDDGQVGVEDDQHEEYPYDVFGDFPPLVVYKPPNEASAQGFGHSASSSDTKRSVDNSNTSDPSQVLAKYDEVVSSAKALKINREGGKATGKGEVRSEIAPY